MPDDHPDKASEIGSEPTPDAWVATMVEVMRGVRRVLRDDGTAWINVGDSAASSGGSHKKGSGNPGISRSADRAGDGIGRRSGRPLNILGLPWRMAFALQADGWILRSDVIWWKSAPMPESVIGSRWERCRVKVRASKRMPPGYYKSDAYGGKPQGSTLDGKTDGRARWAACPGCERCLPNGGLVFKPGSWRPTKSHEYWFMFVKKKGYWADGEPLRGPQGPNIRSVWTNKREKRGGSGHYATFPESLIENIILTCCPASACGKCGKAWSPLIDRGGGSTGGSWHDHEKDGEVGQRKELGDDTTYYRRVERYLPSCACGADPVPGLVLDPFTGTGTTNVVARRLGRTSIGIDINEKYLSTAAARLAADDSAPSPRMIRSGMFQRSLLEG